MLFDAAWGFLRYVAHRFFADMCIQSAGVLTYTTLLAVVPLSAVALGIFSAFPVFGEFTLAVQDFVFANFVPAAGETVRRYVDEFAANASRLTSVGTAFLVATSVMLVAAISEALNRIWKTHQKRTIGGRLAVYWSMLTLGPILIGISLAVSSYLFSLPFFEGQGLQGLRRMLIGALPWATASLAFAITYIIVPDARVPARWAAVGAVVAATLFELAKKGFAVYVTEFAAYQAIYGALAAIPIFLLWIYLCWLIILLGAEVAYCLDQPDRWSGRDDHRYQDLILAYRLIGHLHEAQRTGCGLRERDLLRLERSLGRDRLESMLEMLGRARFVHRTTDGDWALARDAARLTFGELLRAKPFVLPRVGDVSGADVWDRALVDTLAETERNLQAVLDTPLERLYLGKPCPIHAVAPESSS